LLLEDKIPDHDTLQAFVEKYPELTSTFETELSVYKNYITMGRVLMSMERFSNPRKIEREGCFSRRKNTSGYCWYHQAAHALLNSHSEAEGKVAVKNAAAQTKSCDGMPHAKGKAKNVEIRKNC